MSVGTDVDIEAELLLGLEIDDEEELPCEHPLHDEGTIFHEGAGEIYVVIRCAECGVADGARGGNVVLYCERYYNFATTIDIKYIHKACGKLTSTKDMFEYKGRRN